MRTATRARRAFWRRLPIVAVMAAASVLFTTILPAGAATSGSKLWAKRFDGQAIGDDSATDVAVSGDGTRVFVTGGSDGGFTGTDYVTRAYDATTGAKLWTTSYDGLAQFDDDAVALVVSPDDSTVFVTGESSATTNANDYDYATIAYDAASGAELWAKRYDGPANSNDAAFAIAVSPDGQAVFVTGTSISATGSFDFATLAYATSTGARLWKTRYGGRWHGVDEAFGIVVSPDGSSVFVTGNSVSANSFDMETVAYDAATGATEWRGRYDGPANDYDYATALAISPDGTQLFVTGTSTGSGTRRDYTTIAYDTSSGADLWTMRFAGPFDGDDVAEAIAVSPDGSKVFVAGFGPTIAYDASSGAQLWNKVYTGLGEARAIVVSPDGSTVIAAGFYWLPNLPSDLATFAFDSVTGAKVWARHVDGPGSGEDYASSAATSPNGADVFVTGRSVGSTSGYDYLTIAYAI